MLDGKGSSSLAPPLRQLSLHFAEAELRMPPLTRIVAPLLAIETVAAGGGSICHREGRHGNVAENHEVRPLEWC